MFNNETFEITKDYILSKISEEQIFVKYLELEPNDKGLYPNTLRQDKHPGCSFYIDARGHWKFKDFAMAWNWDCFNVVEYYYNCSFKEALIHIAVDFGLVEGKKYDLQFVKRQTKPKITGLRVKRRNWTKSDYDFWLQFGVTDQTLHYYQVFVISDAWFVENNTLRKIYYYTKEDVCFCYHFGGYDYKLYFPFREKTRFLQLRSDIQQGWDQLPETGLNLIHTKSMKDVMAMHEFRSEFDISAIAPMAETIKITKEQFINVYNRFDNHFTLFDFDRTGINLSNEYKKEYKTTPLFFGREFKGGNFIRSENSIKDFADCVKVKGKDYTKILIEKTLEYYNGRK